jgi:hypothetical protein
VREILVSREDCEAVASSDGADQEISVRALNTFRSADIEKRRCLFVVVSRDFGIREGSQVIPHFLEMSAFTNS